MSMSAQAKTAVQPATKAPTIITARDRRLEASEGKREIEGGGESVGAEMGGAAVGEETGPGPGEEEVGDGEGDGEGEGVADGGEEEFAARTCTFIFINPLSQWPGTPQMKPKYPDLTKVTFAPTVLYCTIGLFKLQLSTSALVTSKTLWLLS